MMALQPLLTSGTCTNVQAGTHIQTINIYWKSTKCYTENVYSHICNYHEANNIKQTKINCKQYQSMTILWRKLLEDFNFYYILYTVWCNRFSCCIKNNFKWKLLNNLIFIKCTFSLTILVSRVILETHNYACIF